MRPSRAWCAVLAVLAAAALPGRAQSTLDGFAEIVGTRSTDRSTATDDVTRNSDFHLVTTRLSFVFTQPLHTNLRFVLGGTFEGETVNGTLNDAKVDSKDRRLRPFARLRLATPTLLAEAGWERDDSKTTAGDLETRFIRDSRTGTLGWYPDARNNLQLLVSDSDLYDPTRTVQDASRTNVSLTGQYVPVPWLTLQYQGFRVKSVERIQALESTTTTHAVRATLARSFWNGRVTILADASANRLDIESRATRPGTSDVRVFASAGLSLLSDFPDRGALAVNGALIDNDRNAPAGINIGLPPLGGDERRRNMGLQFTLPSRVNVLWVWVDRPLRPEVAQSFSWDVWTSDDNDLWTLAQTVASAPFGPLDNRFEIAFGAVSARYVKVVTRPLGRAVPFADEYPTIQVTEIDAFERVEVEAGVRRTARNQQNGSFSGRVQLLPVTHLFYELNVLASRADLGERQTIVVNSLILNKDLTRVWSVSARAGRENNDRTLSKSWANFYSAALVATPLPTFRATFGATGRREGGDTGGRNTDALLANASATLYRGLDVQAALGTARSTLSTSGRRTDTVEATLGIQVHPNPSISLYANYHDASRKLTAGGLPDLDDPDKSIQAGLSVSPIRSLYLAGSVTRQKRAEFGQRTLHDYNVSWSPFPFGTLHFNFTYAEAYESQFETLTRNWGPSVRWNVTPRTYLDVSWQESKLESVVQQSLRRALVGTLHIGF